MQHEARPSPRRPSLRHLGAARPSEHQRPLGTGVSWALTCKPEPLADGHSLKFHGAIAMNHPKIPGHTGWFPLPSPACRETAGTEGPPACLLKSPVNSAAGVSGFPLAALKSPSEGQDSGHQGSISAEGSARDRQVVGGDFVLPTRRLSQERLLRCLTRLCSDTGCEHQGPGEDPEVSHSLGCLGWLTSEFQDSPGQNVPDALLSLGTQGTSFRRSRLKSRVALRQV